MQSLFFFYPTCKDLRDNPPPPLYSMHLAHDGAAPEDEGKPNWDLEGVSSVNEVRNPQASKIK